MNPTQQRQLATKIAKESDFVTVKSGRTNGRLCLHLKIDRPEVRMDRDGEDHVVPRLAESITIYDASEWTYHPWNKNTRDREERAADRDLMDAIRNKEAQ